MKVVYILHSTDPFAGATKAFFALLKGLMSKGIEPVVVLPDKEGIYADLAGLNVNVIVETFRPATWTYLRDFKDILLFLPRMFARCYVNRRAARRIAEILNKEQITLIHTNVGVVDIGFRVARQMNIPHIYHIREYGDKDFGMNYFPSKRRFHSQLAQPCSYSICITRDIQRYHKQATNTRSRVIYDGVHSKLDEIPLGEKQNHFLYVGRIERAKGLEILIKAYTHYYNIYKSDALPLRIAGKVMNEDYHKMAVRMINSGGFADKIEWLGERDDVESLMRHARAIIIPSLNEGFGFCMPEAMFNGCLAIGNNTGGTREQFDNGLKLEGREIALRYNTQEELTRLLDEVTKHPAADYQEMIAHAFHAVNSLYSKETHVERVFEFYTTIAEGVSDN